MKYLKHYEKHSDYLNVKDSFSEEKMPMIFRCGNIEHLHFKSLVHPIYKLSGTFLVEEGYTTIPFGVVYKYERGGVETINFEYDSVKKFEIDNKIITNFDEEVLNFGVVGIYVNEGEHTFNVEFSSPLKNLRNLFVESSMVTSLHVSEDVLPKNATNLQSAFSRLQIPNEEFKIFEKLNTSNVTDMSNMFGGCSSLTSLDLSNWDTSNVTDMGYMFSSCNNLTELKMGGNPSGLTNVSNMFSGITTTGTFYYNSTYDYSKIIAVLPSTWAAVPCTMVDDVLVPNN